ncbi:MAG TPA: PP2C family protein-serine/threonine phosphatase [Bryobacteraceae bacterium]|nr:PP2C family protein-serine/threonine phosphatase [Bryobacteraceae bacterium]
MIPFFAFLQDQFPSHLEGDFLLVVLGSVIVAIGFGAIAVHLFRRRPRERFLFWFGLFACPYGLRLLTNTSVFRLAFGEPRLGWQLAGAFLDLVLMIPALLLFQDFYGKGWRSFVRWLIWSYAVFATCAFTVILIQKRPDLFPAAGIGTVFLLPLIILLGWLKGYRLPWVEDRGILSFGLVILFLAFAYDRLVRAQILSWRAWGPLSTSTKEQIEPYGVFVLICCLVYAATRRVLAHERDLVSLEEEMRAARTIQSSILPNAAPKHPGFEAAFRYAPMAAVAGDFYDFFPIQSGGLGIVVADVTGHGVPAALVASMLKVAVSSSNSHVERPGKMIAGLNSTLCGQTKGQYATAVYAYLDEKNRIGCYSAAGHPPPLLWRNITRTVLRLNQNGLLLGVRSNETYPEAEFSLQPGDRLLVYTDGLVEATNPDGLEFGEVRLEQFITRNTDLRADEFAEQLLQEVLAWPGNHNRHPQSDDITIVVIDAERQHVPEKS